jgi:hypothetical protein
MESNRSSTDYHQPEFSMDPVSVTASMAGLLTIATNILKGVFILSTTARDFQNHWKSIANQVSQLVGVLHTLKSSFRPLTNELSLYMSGGSIASSPRDSIPSSSSSTPSEREYDVLSIRRTQEHLSTQLTNEIASCQVTLMEVALLLSQSQLKPGKLISNVRKQLLWPLKKPELKKLLERLESHKSTFVLIFSSQGTYAPCMI